MFGATARASADIARQAGATFLRSAAVFTACDVAATAQHHSKEVRAPSVVLCVDQEAPAGSERRRQFFPPSLVQVWAAGWGASVVLCLAEPRAAVARVLGLAQFAARPSSALPLRLAIPLQAASFAAASYLTTQVMDLPGHAHFTRQTNGAWEETPLTGRHRPQLPVLTDAEALARICDSPTGLLHTLVKLAAGGSELHGR